MSPVKDMASYMRKRRGSDIKYQQQIERSNAKLIARRTATKKALVEIFGGHCKRCGLEFHENVFDFHHLGGKEINIANSLIRGLEFVKNEVSKCIMVCANCHRMIHANNEIWDNSGDFEKKDLENNQLDFLENNK